MFGAVSSKDRRCEVDVRVYPEGFSDGYIHGLHQGEFFRVTCGTGRKCSAIGSGVGSAAPSLGIGGQRPWDCVVALYVFFYRIVGCDGHGLGVPLSSTAGVRSSVALALRERNLDVYAGRAVCISRWFVRLQYWGSWL